MHCGAASPVPFPLSTSPDLAGELKTQRGDTLSVWLPKNTRQSHHFLNTKSSLLLKQEPHESQLQNSLYPHQDASSPFSPRFAPHGQLVLYLAPAGLWLSPVSPMLGTEWVWSFWELSQSWQAVQPCWVGSERGARSLWSCSSQLGHTWQFPVWLWMRERGEIHAESKPQTLLRCSCCPVDSWVVIVVFESQKLLKDLHQPRSWLWSEQAQVFGQVNKQTYQK